MIIPPPAANKLLALCLLLGTAGMAAQAATSCEGNKNVKKAVHKKAVIKKSKHPLDLLKK